MNIVLWLVLFFVSLVLIQKFIREWHFKREPRSLKSSPVLLFPADGVVCYMKSPSDFVVRKRWDVVDVEMKDGEYVQIGIYMSGFDRHVVYSPVRGVVRNVQEVGNSHKNVAMIDFWNFVLYYYFGITPTLVDTEENYSICYGFESSFGMVYVAVVSDKYVGCLIDHVNEGDIVDQRTKICTIRRGSQVDVFVPKKYYDFLCVNAGDQVRIGGALNYV